MFLLWLHQPRLVLLLLLHSWRQPATSFENLIYVLIVSHHRSILLHARDGKARQLVRVITTQPSDKNCHGREQKAWQKGTTPNFFNVTPKKFPILVKNTKRKFRKATE